MATESSLSPKAESVNGDTIEVKCEPSEDGDRGGEFSSTHTGPIKDETLSSATASSTLLQQKPKMSRSSSSSTIKSGATSASSIDKKEAGDRLDERVAKMETLPPLKPGRSGSQRPIPRSAPLFDHLEDATVEAKRSFAVLDACTYANKFLGYTEHAMECDCNEEWGKSGTCIVGQAGSTASKTDIFPFRCGVQAKYSLW
jgi:histone-lysine N-methyltransferase SETD2